jgi:hypothetical protein
MVSYQLRQLSESGLVRARSLADGRDSYYVLDLDRCREPLAGAGALFDPRRARTRTVFRARSNSRGTTLRDRRRG